MRTEDLLKALPLEENAHNIELLRSMRAVSLGQASPDQQKAAYRGFVEFTGFYDLSFTTDEFGGDRVMIYREGRRSVGADFLRIAKAEHLNELTRKA